MGKLRRLVMWVALPALQAVENRLEKPEQHLSEFRVQGGMCIADVGCGLGIYTFPASKLVGPAGTVYAIDKDADCISIVNRELKARRISNIKPVLADAVKTGLPQSCVDLAFLIRVFHDIPDKPKTVEEMHRILKPNGTIAIDDQAITPKETIVSIMSKHGFKLYSLVGKHGLIFAKTTADK